MQCSPRYIMLLVKLAEVVLVKAPLIIDLLRTFSNLPQPQLPYGVEGALA